MLTTPPGAPTMRPEARADDSPKLCALWESVGSDWQRNVPEIGQSVGLMAASRLNSLVFSQNNSLRLTFGARGVPMSTPDQDLLYAFDGHDADSVRAALEAQIEGLA
jgi:hypothetical protein